jgi:hypothetical protein
METEYWSLSGSFTFGNSIINGLAYGMLIVISVCIGDVVVSNDGGPKFCIYPISLETASVMGGRGFTVKVKE